MEQVILHPGQTGPHSASKDSYVNDPDEGLSHRTPDSVYRPANLGLRKRRNEEPIRHPDRTIQGQEQESGSHRPSPWNPTPPTGPLRQGKPRMTGNELDVETVLQNPKGSTSTGTKKSDQVTQRLTRQPGNPPA